MDANLVVFGAIAAILVIVVYVLASRRGDGTSSEQVETMQRLSEMSENLSRAQAELAGRLSQMAEAQASATTQLGERLQAQERVLSKTLDERIGDLTRRMGEGMVEQTKHTATHMTALAERLAVIDAAQKNITELSAQVVSLQDILSNKQTRGAFGEVQLNALVTNALPPSAYQFQATLENRSRVDCLLHLPNPPGSICIDSKFPLESYYALNNAENEADKKLAERAFSAAILKHVKDISEKYIVPGETADSALMFLPSEAIYAELHAHFPDVVEKTYKAKVWIVSPTTLMATLNTVRAVLRDARMREEAGRIQGEVMKMLEDVDRLDKRVGNLDSHFNQAVKDIRDIRISTDKVTKRGERIQEIQLSDETPAEALPSPKERLEQL